MHIGTASARVENPGRMQQESPGGPEATSTECASQSVSRWFWMRRTWSPPGCRLEWNNHGTPSEIVETLPSRTPRKDVRTRNRRASARVDGRSSTPNPFYPCVHANCARRRNFDLRFLATDQQSRSPGRWSANRGPDQSGHSGSTGLEDAGDPTYYPGLATAWEFAPDFTSYTLTLRNDVKFHDGTPFNAEAVKFTFDRIIDPATKSGGALVALGPYESADVIDEFTVKVNFSRANGSFLNMATTVWLSPQSLMGDPAVGTPITRII